jgi:hypothetical protein
VTEQLLGGISVFGSFSLTLQGAFAAGWGYVAFRRLVIR